MFKKISSKDIVIYFKLCAKQVGRSGFLVRGQRKQIVANDVVCEHNGGGDVRVTLDKKKTKYKTLDKIKRIELDEYLENFVDIWRDDSRRVSHRHASELLRKVAHVKFVDDPRHKGRSNLLLRHFLPV